MNLYCPTCQGAFPGTDVCPRCGIRLLTPAEAFAIAPERTGVSQEPINPTFVTRIGIGIAVAAGLYVGMHEWATAVVSPSSEWWGEASGVWFTFAMRVLAVAVGGVLAGAGRKAGVLTGLAVGAAAGGLSVLPDALQGGVDRQAGTLAAVLGGVGLLAGIVGARIWSLSADAFEQTSFTNGSSLAMLAQEEDRRRTVRPTSWPRILIALTLLLVGVTSTGAVRDGLRAGTAGQLKMGGTGNADQVELQIAVIFGALAGGIAGATTGAGLRHGLILGTLAGPIFAALSMRRALPPINGFLETINLPHDMSNPQSLVATIGFVFVGCVASAWLGGQLLPPLAPWWMRKRRLSPS